MIAGLGRFPFYSWIRLFFLSYLVLPQTQGARLLYEQYVDPFLAHHEREIEEFIGRSHERAKAMGLQYLNTLIDLVREKLLGLPARRPQTPPSAAASGPAAYAQSLLSRFNIPTAGYTSQGPGPAPASNDWYSAFTSAISAATGASAVGTGTRDVRPEELIPSQVESMSRADRARFFEMLGTLRSALVRQEPNLEQHDQPERAGHHRGRDEDEDDDVDDGLAYGGVGIGGAPLKKNRSDNSFENIEPEDVASHRLDHGHPAEDRRSMANVGSRRSGSGGGWRETWFGGRAGEHPQHGGGAAESSGVEFAARSIDEIHRTRAPRQDL